MLTLEIGDNLSLTLIIIAIAAALAWYGRGKRGL